jgi:DNA-binding protein Fis
MSANSNTPPSAASVPDYGSILDVRTRLRLGLQLQALYELVLDEVLNPHLAELLQQLESGRDQRQAG